MQKLGPDVSVVKSNISLCTLVQPQGNLELKFKRNAINRSWDNCDNDCDGDAGHVEAPYHELCWQSQAELKMPVTQWNMAVCNGMWNIL